MTDLFLGIIVVELTAVVFMLYKYVINQVVMGQIMLRLDSRFAAMTVEPPKESEVWIG
jgi:hypothetical protein